ncbi:hypothetical protein ND16A_3728 [Thalassotalea sp. ND16A]|nr:hypothetical protein ND16A_3728 [Thalassotalea sp. ND16A]
MLNGFYRSNIHLAAPKFRARRHGQEQGYQIENIDRLGQQVKLKC